MWYEKNASILQHAGRNDQALPLAEKALRMDLQEFNAEHPHVADRRMLLAGVLKNLGRIEEAKRELDQALTILERSVPESDLRILRARRSLQLLSQTATMDVD